MGLRLFVAGCLLLAGCSSAAPAVDGLRYLGELQLPAGASLDGTVIGGLSAISYDPGSQQYYLVSDDRSAHNPARFYTARIALSDNGIDDVTFLATRPWRDVDGRVFPPLDPAADPAVVPPDAEGIVIDAQRGRLYWSSEGERLTSDVPGAPVLSDPWVRIADLDGGYLGAFELPPGFAMSADETGPRRNSGLEGLALSPDGRYLYAALEAPLYQDGAAPDTGHGALTRVVRLDVETRKPLAQFLYPLDPVSAGPGGNNGLSDLVALDEDTFLVVERGYGTYAVSRIYRATLAAEGAAMTKTLLVDLSRLPGLDRLDNIEGITLGPTLPDGRRTVVLVSDDNFSPTQVTQFLAFAM